MIRCWPVITIQTASCAKVPLSEYITIGLQCSRNVLLGVPKMICWLVLDGVIECIWIKVRKVRNSGKILSLFTVILQRLMGAFSQNSCLSGLVFEDSLVQSLTFVLWVSFLAGVLNWNRCVKFRSLL